MVNFKRPLTVLKNFLPILLILIIYGCASMKSPEGGPKDTTPPKVLKMEPADLTTNFSGQKIVITFDEYFNLQNEFKEFSISPELEKAPELKKNQKKLEIIFKDSLEKNTTYTLNFGKAIADVNESNVLKNLTYAFSTGPVLDSLTLSGVVINSLTDKPQYDATVLLIPLERDTIFGKKRAPIFTSTDSSGRFKLKNLRNDTYRIYALNEGQSGDKIYQQANDEVAFLKDSIVLTKNIDSIQLILFKEDPKQFRIVDKKINTDGHISMIFNQKLEKPRLTILDHPDLDQSKIIHFNKNRDSVRIWLKELTFDSLKIHLENDSKTLDTISFSRDKKETYTKSIQVNDNTFNGFLNPFSSLKLQFNMPIEKIAMDKIKLLEDSIPRTNFTFVKDTSDLLTYIFQYPWKKKPSYTISFPEKTITALGDVTNANEIKKFVKLGNSDDYSTLIMIVEVPDSTQQYLIQLVNDRKEVVKTEIVTKNTTIRFANYKAGTYLARIVYDRNKNGKWDTGNLDDQSQPEKIWVFPNELIIKENWERTVNLTIKKE